MERSVFSNLFFLPILFTTKLLLAEWHTLDLDLDLAALDILEPQCDLLLDLAIRNGDDAVLGEHTVDVFTG